MGGGRDTEEAPEDLRRTHRQKDVRMKPVGSLAVVLAVVLVVLRFSRQLQLTLTALLQEPVGLQKANKQNTHLHADRHLYTRILFTSNI